MAKRRSRIGCPSSTRRQSSQTRPGTNRRHDAAARVKKVEAELREALLPQEKEFRANRFVESVEWDDLRTKILRSQDVQSAAESERLSKRVDSLVAMAKQQAEAGKLDLDALRNIAQVGGIEAGKMQQVLKMIFDFLRTTANKP